MQDFIPIQSAGGDRIEELTNITQKIEGKKNIELAVWKGVFESYGTAHNFVIFILEISKNKLIIMKQKKKEEKKKRQSCVRMISDKTRRE